MRYSFHGKVRATGQQVDGFVEAATASLAIDRLADKGIIGVYSVRPEPRPPRHAVTVGEDANKETDDRSNRGDRRATRALPGNSQPATPASIPVAASSASVVPADVATAELLKQLVDKITALTGKVEAVLARPQSVVYQSGGPARNGNSSGKKPRAGGDVQNSTLRDIFQNNLDLRQSLEKLAKTVGPSTVKPSETAPREVAAKREAIRESSNGTHDNGSHEDGSHEDGSHEPSIMPRELVNQAQPAA